LNQLLKGCSPAIAETANNNPQPKPKTILFIPHTPFFYSSPTISRWVKN
jgi:hypothetical protein